MHIFQTKMNNLEKNLSEQKINATSSIFELKKKEISLRHKCNCRSYCRVFHQKHNFVKSESNLLFRKFNKILDENPKHDSATEEVIISLTGVIKKRYPCTQCEQEFNKQGHLKKHMKAETGGLS
jgi:hypothetical protein